MDYLHILDDDPASEDEFGSHDRVAEAIASVLINEKNNPGKAIALVGKWGSGKSTIINKLKDLIKTSDDHSLFYFDAWIHQGDNLRRHFLISLYKHVKGNNDNDKTIDIISGKRVDEIISTNLSLFGILFGFFIICIPIVSSLLSLMTKIERGSIPFHLSVFIINHIESILYIGIFIIFVPFLLFIMYFLIRFMRRDATCLKPNINSFINSDNVHKTTKTSPTMTSIEFEEHFNIILDLIPEQKMVIVIDNLDRLDKCEIKSVWSTMRTFVDTDSPSHRDNIWLIVPFDKDFMESVWNDDVKGKNADGISFIDKTFQIVFNSPPIVVSDWKSYMMKLLLATFPLDTATLHTIVIIYSHSYKYVEDPPTPRNIKRFVNNLLASYWQWRDDIPIAYQALYLCLIKRTEISFLLRNYASSLDYPKDILPEKDGEKYMAALYFNIEPSKAIQIYYANMIDNALRTKTVDKALLEAMSFLSFTSYIESYADNLLNTKYDVENIFQFITLISTINYENESTNRVWSSLINAATSIEINNLSKSIGLGVGSLLTKTQNKSYLVHLIDYLNSETPLSIFNVSKPDVQDRTPSIEVYLAIIDAIKKIPSFEESLQKVKNLLSTKAYLCIADTVSYRKDLKEIFEYVVPTSLDGDDIINIIDNMVINDSWKDIINPLTLQLLIEIHDQWKWHRINKTIITILKSKYNTYLEEKVNWLTRAAIICDVDYESRSNYTLRSVVLDGMMFYHLRQSLHNYPIDTYTSSLCIISIIMHNYTTENDYEDPYIKEGRKLFIKIMNLSDISSPENVIPEMHKATFIQLVRLYRLESVIIKAYRENNNKRKYPFMEQVYEELKITKLA